MLYLHCQTGDDNKGGVTLAVKQIGPDLYKWGTAICDVRDQYGRKKGRLIAKGRCERQRHGSRLVDMCGVVNGKTLLSEVWDDVIHHAKAAVLYVATPESKKPLCAALTRGLLRVVENEKARSEHGVG